MLGGLVSDRLGWPWIFRIHCAPGVVALALIMAAYRPAVARAARQRMDYPGMALLLLMAAPALLALIWGGVRYDWNSWQIAALLLAFVSADTAPAAIAACSVIAGVGMGGMLAALTVLVQQLPEAVVASAIASLQYCRLLGGSIRLAVLGGTMGWRFERRVTGGFDPDTLSRIPRDVLESIADNPGLLFGPAYEGVIESDLLGFIGNDMTMATVVESLRLAMQTSVLEIFGLCMAAVAACVAVSLLIREPARDRP